MLQRNKTVTINSVRNMGSAQRQGRTKARLEVIDTGTDRIEIGSFQAEKLAENGFAKRIFGKVIVQFQYVSKRHSGIAVF